MHDLISSLECHIGKTVTIFTASGGLSGAGFTGVLACVGGGFVKLITAIGAAPACPVGSSCVGGWSPCSDNVGFGGGCADGCNNGWGNTFAGGSWGVSGGFGGGFAGGGFTNWLGAVAQIPLDKVVSFTHNSIS